VLFRSSQTGTTGTTKPAKGDKVRGGKAKGDKAKGEKGAGQSQGATGGQKAGSGSHTANS
jgi:hypothetical protein